jgi:uncharacterized protein (DUF305 family)
MNRKPLLYSLGGLLAGGAIAALAMFLTIKTSPQTSTLVYSTDKTSLAQNQVTPLPKATSPSDTTPPFRPGMMGHSDRHFIVMMIPHHDGAVAMADLALSQAKHPELKKLAQTIKTTQTKEIQQMRIWYKQWYGADVPGWGPGRGWGWNSRNRQQQGNNQQPVWGPGREMYRGWDDWDRQWGARMGCCMGGGWMGTNLSALKNAPDFDREFIQQMIPHHQMGVMMASMVLNSSERPEIRNLAQSIIKSQTDEINQMQQWYQKWYQQTSQ